ncbi:hypothetical protein ACFFOS_27415 [Nocardioides kongjuensis]|uniref:DUF1611 domain-containing protein n=1 Tax=Nocardioides kongjuensis TaxID=349522 RepID=A0A852RPT8_9ACTN|nr:DUF1611 domain-containing protein [Nocardioides kongjuensis]NYD32719.1 hypothetical protein [Nocardioides kongjuensis]
MGDLIVVAYADRYAPDQFESEVPDRLEPTQLVASGGIASKVLSRSRAVRAATDIVPLGLIGDERGQPLNVREFALPPVTPTRPRPVTLAVVGTSMNSGKTTTVHHIAEGMARRGVRVGTTKVTGTGSGGDYWVMLDAGAWPMLDFTDVGLASTYRQPVGLLEEKMLELVDHLTESGTQLNLVEIADGLYQQETAQLIRSEAFQSIADAVIFAAGDAMGAVHGAEVLKALGHNLLGVSGRITTSPLATREAEEALGMHILTLADLADADSMGACLGITVPDLADAGGSVAGEAASWELSLPGLADGIVHERGGIGEHEVGSRS